MTELDTRCKTGDEVSALVQPDRVHGSAYTDPGVFEQEMQRIFRKGWVYVAHESEIPERGDYVTRRIGGDPVIVAHGKDDEVRVLHNRCSHRGNRICSADKGNANSFRCHYHGWTFGNDGSLLGVPMKDGYAGHIDELNDQLGLAPAARVDSYRGFIFASLAPTGLTLLEHLGRATSAIDRLLDLSPTGRLALTAGWMKHHNRCNWKMIMENNVDGYHALFTHKSVYEAVRPAKVSHVPSKVKVLVRDLGNGHSEIDYSNEYKALDDELVWYGRAPRESMPNYVESLEQAYGAEKTHDTLVVGPPHTLIFPNLFIAEMNIMMIEPLGPGEAVAYYTPALLEGGEELNAKMLRRTEGALGPAGFLLADDGEIAARNQRGLAAQSPEWLELSRGAKTDQEDETGTVNWDKSAETPQRGFWKQWVRVMGGAK